MIYFTKRLFPIILLFIGITYSHAQDVQVRNVTFTQMDELIIIRYDLDGLLNKEYQVKLSLSDDYGASFRIKPYAVRGDVGKGVIPGVGKEIIWTITDDYPTGIEGDGFVFAVDAELKKGGSKFLYYLLGGGVVGGIVYFVSKGGGETGVNGEPTTGSISITIPGDM